MGSSIKISDHFTFGRLALFTLPSVAMMIFTSVYTVVDGLFVSNFAGMEAFAALNLIYPFIAVLGAVGFMVGTGGSALVAKTMGEGDDDRARRIFSMLVWAVAAFGVVLSVAGFALVRPVAQLMGAEGALVDGCVLYGGILCASLTFFMLLNVFQSFLVAAGKPQLGLAIMVLAGVTNIVLDALFIVVLSWGLAGAAVATAISQAVGGLVPLVYFARKNSSTLRIVKTRFDGRALGKTCVNGSSEFMTNVAMSVVGMLYNYQLMKLVGPDGVAAYGVIMYVGFIFAAIFMGYCIGSSPLVSYQHGAKNHAELKNLFKKGLAIVGGMGVALTVLALAIARPLTDLFVGYDPVVEALTMQGLALYSYVFLIMGFNIFGSALFTALNNGLVSALISFLRTLVFEVAAVLLLPMVLGVDGVWLSIVAAELAALVVTTAFVVGLRKPYGYA